MKKQLYSDAQVLETKFLKYRQELFPQIVRLLAFIDLSNEWIIVEIGTGDGLFLNYMSENIRGIPAFVGIDLNEDQIVENRKTYQNRTIQFVHGEIEDWIAEHPRRSGLIFAACGTFE